MVKNGSVTNGKEWECDKWVEGECDKWEPSGVTNETTGCHKGETSGKVRLAWLEASYRRALDLEACILLLEAQRDHRIPTETLRAEEHLKGETMIWFNIR